MGSQWANFYCHVAIGCCMYFPMEAVHSFAPLAGRLAAKAAEIRPADGAEVSWANFMALFFCAILHMLIALCEALDARAAADARLAAAPAGRAGRVAMPGAERAPRLARAPVEQAVATIPAVAPSRTAGPVRGGPWLAWSCHPDLIWKDADRVAVLPKNVVLWPGFKHVLFVAITL